jgi:hypothetical protein
MAQNTLADILERAATTAAEVYIGLAVADGFDLTDVQDNKRAALAGITAALAVIKGALSSWLGKKGSAAALPANLDT